MFCYDARLSVTRHQKQHNKHIRCICKNGGAWCEYGVLPQRQRVLIIGIWTGVSYMVGASYRSWTSFVGCVIWPVRNGVWNQESQIFCEEVDLQFGSWYPNDREESERLLVCGSDARALVPGLQFNSTFDILCTVSIVSKCKAVRL